ncbi:hypothetical protein Goarm_020253, partial [Gossypium armourianum]|nr:hypothetical protein [Gossypium armourianum]
MDVYATFKFIRQLSFSSIDIDIIISAREREFERAEASEFGPSMGIKGGNAARIPEHTCHKVIETNTCELQKCIHECSKEPAGVGDCTDYN